MISNFKQLEIRLLAWRRFTVSQKGMVFVEKTYVKRKSLRARSSLSEGQEP